ncbi:MAG: calcium-translocating P-type ATPase, PMCA-type [Clostridia bacterium]|nr:calcium-translocating P-type ATPase, PMCA-type [Clostridia bacterium]
MKEYLKEQDVVLAEQKTTADGLSSAEVQSRLEKYGKNKLAEGKKVTLLQRFLAQLADPMIIILIIAAVISGVVGVMEGEGLADVIIIMAVVLINAILGVFQESKAEKAIEALQEIAAATSKVIRDGHQMTIHSEDLVPGDIIVLEAGDAVPADARLIECASLKIEEAALTGESVPVTKHIDVLTAPEGKDVPLGDRKNMVYMGSTVVYGRGKAVVTDTGMQTEMGKIADALTKAEEGETPLQLKLNQLSKILSVLVLGICVVVFAVDILRLLPNGLKFEDLISTFMVAISLAVAAIPEGLAAVVTIVLSIGVTNMSKRNAVIRRLTAVETLGCAQIICSDKTGTLTQNKMTVVDHSGDDEKLLARAMALSSDAELDEKGEATGEPTECALVNYANQLGMPKTALKSEAPRIGEAPFDSMRKMMSTVHQTADGIVQFTKGAPDEVLKRCTTMLKDGKVVALTDAARAEILAANKRFADQALRVLCAAQRLWDAAPAEYEPEFLEQELCYIGLTGMIDPVRPEVKPAIERCAEAGIRPIMITGDHRDTAIAIATQLGIITDPSQAITGAQLDEISDEQLETEIEKYSVYARVQPEHKVRIVNAWRAKGKITAMTGDGVNDAPSIKNADIGIGMGITGTDVTKNVADMVLADDNFATIVSAVEEGRRIYDNIRKSIQFLLSSNLSEVLSIFFASLVGFTILKPVHLLFINLITDCFPALALSMEKGERDIMKREPRNAKDGIFAGGMGFDVVLQGIMATIITIAAYYIGHFMESGVWEFVDSEDGMTMAFLALSMAEIFHSFNLRSRRKSIFALKTQNIFLWGAMILSLVATTLVIYVPFLREAFEFAHISFAEYAVAMLLAVSVIPIIELIKLIERCIDRAKKK